MANRTLGTITTMLTLNNSAFKKGIGNSKKSVNKFSKGVSNLGGMIAGAFAARSIINFASEASKLAGIMEGVKKAFDRIKPSINFLNELKIATAGTVSELNLMKRAVMASNFNIPLSELATLLKFATKRAQETGESVDYLVNSVVIGIGRKSPLILDNLGISAVDLRQKLENVGHSGATVGDVAKAVGEIATDAMEKMGDVTETTAIRQERLNASIVDMKVELGNAANVIIYDIYPALTKFIKAITTTQNVLKYGWEGARAMGEIDSFMNTWASRLSDVKTQMEGIERIDVFGNKSGEDLLIEDITKKIGEYAHMMEGASGETRSFYEYMVKGLVDWRDSFNKTSNVGAKTIGMLKENLKMMKEELELTPLDVDTTGLIKKINELDQRIKNLIKYGQDLPPILTPNNLNTKDVEPLGMWADGDDTETWIESLRRRREEMERFRDSLKETGVDAEDIGTQIGMTMVNSLDSLGEAFARLKMGAEGALNDLGELLLKNLGNILMMVGMANPATGMALVAAGAALQFGSGILSGLGSSAPSGQGANSSGTVDFRISGNDLVGALQRNNVRNSLVT